MMRLKMAARAYAQEDSIYALPEHLRTESEEYWLWVRQISEKYGPNPMELYDPGITPERKAEVQAALDEQDRMFEMTMKEVLAKGVGGLKDLHGDRDNMLKKSGRLDSSGNQMVRFAAAYCRRVVRGATRGLASLFA